MERNLLVHRRTWTVITSGLFEPIFYLFSIGVGVGALVGEIEVEGAGVVSYTAFVAPALLAASAMNGAVTEATFNIFHKLKWAKIYDAMLATPLVPLDIAFGEIGWSLARGGIYASGFMGVMLAMGLTNSWWALLIIPAALLIGLAFGAVGMAATTFMRSWQDFDMVQLVTLPLFLFSATFYPLEVYPPAIRAVTHLSPLFHGAELVRALSLGTVTPSNLWNVAFLVVMATAGLAVTNRRLVRLLLP